MSREIWLQRICWGRGRNLLVKSDEFIVTHLLCDSIFQGFHWEVPWVKPSSSTMSNSEESLIPCTLLFPRSKENSDRPLETYPRPSTTCLRRTSFHICIFWGTWGMFLSGSRGIVWDKCLKALTPRWTIPYNNSIPSKFNPFQKLKTCWWTYAPQKPNAGWIESGED